MFVNNIDPVLFDFGFLTVRWYGLFLGLGVALALFLLMRLFKDRGLNPDDALSIGLYLTIGGLLGARIGHILFYNFDYFRSNLIEILMIQHGGLSSHGMALGLIIAFLIYVRVKRVEWRKYIDLLVIPIPLVAGFIRIGNYFNSEIVGRATDLPWAVQFPLFELSAIGRHPTQIYEALIAFAIFGVLIWMHRRSKIKTSPLPKGGLRGVAVDQILLTTHTFIFLYFSTRFLIEFLKEYHTLDVGLTMGQWLSIPFILYSIGWFVYRISKTPSSRRSAEL